MHPPPFFLDLSNFFIPPKKEKKRQASQNCIGPTLRIGQETQCLPYAGYFKIQKIHENPLQKNKNNLSTMVRKSKKPQISKKSLKKKKSKNFNFFFKSKKFK